VGTDAGLVGGGEMVWEKEGRKSCSRGSCLQRGKARRNR
jgi:hypothetical protein